MSIFSWNLSDLTMEATLNSRSKSLLSARREGGREGGADRSITDWQQHGESVILLNTYNKHIF